MTPHGLPERLVFDRDSYTAMQVREDMACQQVIDMVADHNDAMVRRIEEEARLGVGAFYVERGNKQWIKK